MIIDSSFAEELALNLLEINAVVLRPNDPFTWASGWHSPIYCDNRLTLRHPEIRRTIARHFTDFIRENHSDVEVITGTATAGIPHAAWVAGNLDRPMSYVRARPKTYGMGNQIEGGIQKGESTLVVEDLISTGGSALSVVEALRFIGADVLGILSIFTYGFDRSVERFKEIDIPVYSLTDYTTLVNVAVENDYIAQKDLEMLGKWRQSPDTWPN
ncbi:MAG: orotate phosphoribosyltransferase [Balneolaceae bacterium]|nr:orotate phosphoribosyltransferase [Balneolaceae bacterium]